MAKTMNTQGYLDATLRSVRARNRVALSLDDVPLPAEASARTRLAAANASMTANASA